MSEDDMYIDGYYDNDGFEVADDMEIDHFDDDLDSDDVDWFDFNVWEILVNIDLIYEFITY